MFDYITALSRNTKTSMTVDGITYRVVTMTPELASTLLRLNDGNRNRSDGVVSAYRADMRRHQWVYAADPIRISRTNRLIDGQHRCTAMAEQPEGTTEDFLVVTGLDDDVQLVLDQGKKRSAADQLTLNGVKNATMVAATARLVIRMQTGRMFMDNKIAAEEYTTSQVLDWVDDNPESVAIIQRLADPAANCLMSPSCVTTLAVLAAQTDPDAVITFVHRLADGANLASGDPILALRNRNIKYSAEHRRDSQRDQVGILIKAWNAWISGKRLSKIQLPKGGTFTEKSFPEISRKGRGLSVA